MNKFAHSCLKTESSTDAPHRLRRSQTHLVTISSPPFLHKQTTKANRRVIFFFLFFISQLLDNYLSFTVQFPLKRAFQTKSFAGIWGGWYNCTRRLLSRCKKRSFILAAVESSSLCEGIRGEIPTFYFTAAAFDCS